jgi:hypothetical protein
MEEKIVTPNEMEFEAVKFIKKRDKVCIIGFAPSWAETKWDDPETDYWGINELYMQAVNKRFDAWFEVHDIKNSPSKQEPKHQAFLKDCKIPLLTQKHWDDYPSSIAFPWKYLMEFYDLNLVKDEGGGGFEDYSNQISWMIALAITLGYKQINIYGVDMAQESEYMHQRASCQFFIGYALGAGIKVFVPKSCELLKGGAPYGFESDNANRHRKKSRIKSISQQIKSIEIRQKEIKFWIEEELQVKLNQEILSSSEKLRFLKGQFAAAQMNQAPTGQLEAEIKAIEGALFDTKKGIYVNIRLLEDEYNQLEKNKESLKGIIKECQHDLNNNLV